MVVASMWVAGPRRVTRRQVAKKEKNPARSFPVGFIVCNHLLVLFSRICGIYLLFTLGHLRLLWDDTTTLHVGFV